MSNRSKFKTCNVLRSVLYTSGQLAAPRIFLALADVIF